ncbi:MAG: hypothetical protein UW03_C0002G0010 [Candidatus Peregrinibacteria bacterium GW2011_GWA2_43_8]|nr:MAG: hypothetical protein UW03_C0002G0010 [Candidatus Peregrinibacteria bacterium GW2011_GWA2_43_8]
MWGLVLRIRFVQCGGVFLCAKIGANSDTKLMRGVDVLRCEVSSRNSDTGSACYDVVAVRFLHQNPDRAMCGVS